MALFAVPKKCEAEVCVPGKRMLLSAHGRADMQRMEMVQKTPAYTPDIAAATRFLLDSGAAAGLYHCVNSGSATWEQVAREVARGLGIQPILDLMTMEQVQMRASRPRFCALSTDKIAAAGFPMPTWQDAIARWLASRNAVSQSN